MDIRLNELDDGFELLLGETVIALSDADFESLARQVKALRPHAHHAPITGRAYLRRLQQADEIGISKLLRSARHEDILAILKGEEANDDLLKMFYGSMSMRMTRMIIDDLQEFGSDPPPTQRLDEALENLKVIGLRLERAGELVLAEPRQPA